MTPCPLCRHSETRTLFEKDGHPIHRCRKCGLVTRGGPDGPPSYHDYLPSQTQTLPPLTRTRYLDLLRGFERHRETGRFYDIGCGGGFLVEVAAELGWQAEGLEISQAAVDFGRKRGLTLHCGALDEVAPPHGEYDVVTLMEVVEHLADPVALLLQARSLLRPGGVLYLTTPNWGSLTRRFVGPGWAPINRDHVVYFTPRHMHRALGAAHLAPIRVTSANLEPHAILARFRKPAPAGAASADTDRWAQVERTRQTVEANAVLRAAKACLNGLLSLTGSGDTIRALARRVET